jgi:hypothetical protein
MDRSLRTSQSPNRFSKLRTGQDNHHSFEANRNRGSHDSQPQSPLGKYFEFATGSDEDMKQQDVSNGFQGVTTGTSASFKLPLRFPVMGSFSDSLRSSASSTGAYSSNEGRGSSFDAAGHLSGGAGTNGATDPGLGNSGVGLYFRPDSNGQYFVEGVIPMSSAHRCGLIQRGDELLAVSTRLRATPCTCLARPPLHFMRAILLSVLHTTAAPPRRPAAACLEDAPPPFPHLPFSARNTDCLRGRSGRRASRLFRFRGAM